MLLINITNNLTSSYPLWFFITDIFIILINLIGIIAAMIFIFTVIRLEYPTYSISNLIACQTCLAIGLINSATLINDFYALTSFVKDWQYNQSFCILRGTIFSISFVAMYTSLCLKAFNRLRCIVYRIRSVARSYKCLFILILIQWIFVAILSLPILLTNAIEYEQYSHLCLVTTNKKWQFSFLMIIYYTSILFISSVYLYILYYVMHLSLLERYRRKRQLALFRRIFILLFMIILPGLFYLILIICWVYFDSIPFYSFKIVTLVESIGHSGTILTIFISNTRIRRRIYNKRKLLKKKTKLKRIPKDHYDLIFFQQSIQKL